MTACLGICKRIDKQLSDDIAVVSSISAPLLAHLAAVAYVPASVLRDDSMKLLHIQVGYIEARMREVRKPPWSLIGGDISSKLQTFGAGPVPQEETSRKMHTLINMGYSQAIIEQGVQLLSQCPWTSKLVEQLWLGQTPFLGVSGVAPGQQSM